MLVAGHDGDFLPFLEPFLSGPDTVSIFDTPDTVSALIFVSEILIFQFWVLVLVLALVLVVVLVLLCGCGIGIGIGILH